MKKTLWISVLLFLPFFSEAFQVSGYISIKCIGGYTYQITVVDYTIGDPQNSGACGGTDIDTLRIHFGDGTSDLLTRYNGSGDSVCQCRKLNTYISNHTFAGPGTYYIWLDVLPRAAGVVNMINSAGQDMFIFHTLIIPPAGAGSLPVITNPPICGYGCTSDCYYFNLNAYSPGGDSIAYSLGNCLPGVGYYNPGATINQITGELSWCNPAVDGLYSFAILMVTYKTTYETIGSNTVKLVQPIDTEEVEQQVYIQSDCALGTPKVNNNAATVNVYPNPNNGVFTVAFTHPEVVSGLPTIEIYNVLGSKIYSAALNPSADGEGDKNIDLFSRPAGLYLYRVISQDGNLMGEGRLIIQK
jgi:hypothetical protein